MVGYTFSYLIGTLALLVIWVILFLQRKDTRKEILIISIVLGFVGLIVDPIYASDWWFPTLITNTIPGIESFLLGFAIGGITTAIYPILFKKKMKKENEKINLNFLFIGGLVIALFLALYFAGLNSFHAAIPAFLIPTIIIYIKRKDLIINSIVSAILLTIISLLFYLLPELITPGWISATWNFELISGIIILKAPLEDLIWIFMVGLLIGPFYEYWQESKLIKMKK